MHVHGRLGERELRTITPKVLNRFRADLEHASVGSATVVKAMALVQSILSFAVVEERVEFNAMAVVRKPTYERAGATDLPAGRRRGVPGQAQPARRDARLAAGL